MINGYKFLSFFFPCSISSMYFTLTAFFSVRPTIVFVFFTICSNGGNTFSSAPLINLNGFAVPFSETGLPSAPISSLANVT